MPLGSELPNNYPQLVKGPRSLAILERLPTPDENQREAGTRKSILPHSTGLFTGSAAAALWTPATGRRARVKTLTFQLSNAATVSSAADVTLTIYDNGIPTQWQALFAVGASVTAGNGLTGIQMLLAEDGWLQQSGTGNPLTVVASVPLTAGNFLVLAGGYEE